jgi:hypothetical protein
MKITKEMANRLNTMNYVVSTREGQYYITDGIAGLYRFSKINGYDYPTLLEEMILVEQVEYNGEEEYSITMI